MSQTLKLNNFNSNNLLNRTTLTQDEAAAVSSLNVVNSADFVAGPVLIGAPGGQSTEMATATAPGLSSQIPLSTATTLQHNNNEPVFVLFGNQLKVYSATDQYGTGQQPDDDNFALVGTPIALDASQTHTLFTDGDGVAGMWYKFTYYNSVSGAETAVADSNAVQVGRLHYVSTDQVRRAAGFTNSPNVTESIIAEFRDAAENEINGALLPVYAFPLPTPTNPIVVQIAKDIAAGELKHEMYQNVAPDMAKDGEDKANKARNGGGSHTSLADLVLRVVVLEDAQFNELTIEEGHGFGGWPDDTTAGTSSSQGGDHGAQFRINEEY